MSLLISSHMPGKVRDDIFIHSKTSMDTSMVFENE